MRATLLMLASLILLPSVSAQELREWRDCSLATFPPAPPSDGSSFFSVHEDLRRPGTFIVRREDVEAFDTTWETPAVESMSANVTVINQVRRKTEPVVRKPTCYIAEMTVTPPLGYDHYEFWWYFSYPGRCEHCEGIGATRVIPASIPAMNPAMVVAMALILLAFGLIRHH